VGTLQGLGVGFNAGVCAACTKATFKVVALCVVIGSLMRAGRLPRETPVVLSKLAFNVRLATYHLNNFTSTIALIVS